jgi:hypothetical protein
MSSAGVLLCLSQKSPSYGVPLRETGRWLSDNLRERAGREVSARTAAVGKQKPHGPLSDAAGRKMADTGGIPVTAGGRRHPHARIGPCEFPETRVHCRYAIKDEGRP